jgi:putative zinc finger/helix-turn-helix YgiT family protein
MMSEVPISPKSRPFPWRCFECKAKEVFPVATDYTTTVKHDGRGYTIRIPDLAIPTCRQCGAQTFSVGDDVRIVAALRAKVGLLTPEEMHQRRSELELGQEELAEYLGVDAEAIARWESGALLQSRAMDKLLRLFFESEEVRRLLRQKRQAETVAHHG